MVKHSWFGGVVSALLVAPLAVFGLGKCAPEPHLPSFQQGAPAATTVPLPQAAPVKKNAPVGSPGHRKVPKDAVPAPKKAPAPTPEPPKCEWPLDRLTKDCK